MSTTASAANKSHHASLSPITSSPKNRRRSSSIISHVEVESDEELNDQNLVPNLNANWVHSKGAWLIHICIILLLKMFFNVLPGSTTELSWTLTNTTYIIGSYIMFHQVKGTPFDFNSGAYDNLTMWEQIDNGDQYTPTKKFLFLVPIALFLASTHYSKYNLNYFVFNGVLCLIGCIPKMAFTHRLRISIPGLTKANI
ncbi:sphingolipid homeostasis protein [Saccharomycopsis crataegensis]|uniref:Sphingolipid homeostasis protein n=1 Tax=Saccharomycopsis crataegensis TaxID=43959 RepID=A0AAV5QFD4_9ASCO|nr:sphingolipid homeostasis protein [Saccharomycopsis crataegensis]